jgi:hypothetical protein
MTFLEDVGEYFVCVCLYIYIYIYIYTNIYTYSVHINYRRFLLLHTLGRMCRNIVKFMSITYSEHNIWNSSIVASATLREKHKPVLEGNGCLNDRV